MKVLMVCLGNICRSPAAEGILRYKAEKAGIEMLIDSCGTANYHIGSCPDERMIQVSEENGIDISHLKARQFHHDDFSVFDVIYAMDESNYSHLIALTTSDDEKRKIRLLLKEDNKRLNVNVPDPYYGSINDFREVFGLLNDHMDLVLEKMNRER